MVFIALMKMAKPSKAWPSIQVILLENCLFIASIEKVYSPKHLRFQASKFLWKPVQQQTQGIEGCVYVCVVSKEYV